MTDPTLEELLLQNPNAPTNDDFAINFASRLFPRREDRSEGPVTFDFTEGLTAFEASDDEQIDWCGEASRGLLEAVLASDLLSESAVARIENMMADAAPALERDRRIGHFHFHWTETSSNSNDNTNEANIDATGAILNDCWDRYVADFRQPKADLINGERVIEVRVYDDPGLHGSTSSHTNRIFLNSRTVVNDDCRRRTTSAHELFHRVQYSYGYITGTAGQRWWVEALGSWSQEYFAPDIDDYISRVNSGLANPSAALLSRSYNACHYWKYLGEQLSKRSAAISSEHQAVREVLDEYASNGLDAKAASGTVTQNRISRRFDRFFQDWSKANYLKDLTSPSLRYDYDEDETVTSSCGRTYGPHRQIAPDTDHAIAGNSSSWSSGIRTVNAYGSRYHNFDIDPSVTEFELRFDGNPGGGSGNFTFHVALIKDNRWRTIYNTPSTTGTTRHLSFDAGDYDRCVVFVNGLATGGSYELGLNVCLTGVWKDGFNFVWSLTQAGDDITGTVATSSCGTYQVTGTLIGNDMALAATGSCCDFTYQGTVTDCSTANGSWTSACGGSGSFSMARTNAAEADAAVAAEAMELADDPATMGAV